MRKTRKRNASTFHKISTKIAWNVSEYSGSSQNKKWKSRNTKIPRRDTTSSDNRYSLCLDKADNLILLVITFSGDKVCGVKDKRLTMLVKNLIIALNIIV